MRLNIKVHPNSSREEIIQLDEQNYTVYLKKPAYEGKANKELISLLKKHFKASIRIIKGETSKNKVIEVENCQ